DCRLASAMIHRDWVARRTGAAEWFGGRLPLRERARRPGRKFWRERKDLNIRIRAQIPSLIPRCDRNNVAPRPANSAGNSPSQRVSLSIRTDWEAGGPEFLDRVRR